MLYEVRFFRAGGEVYAIETLEALDDDTVIETASRVFRSGIGAGYEIWLGERLVHRTCLSEPSRD